MRIQCAPISDDLRREALLCVENFDIDGEVIYQGRNTIKVFDTPQGRLNVKAFRIPGLLNRLIYTFVRSPKGQRAFDYPRVMAARGVATPSPLIYMEERKHGLIARSWLVTRQSPLSRRMYEFGDKDMTDTADREIISAFARFAAKMHEAGLLHRDFSPGNILFDRLDGQWRFEVVDVNRMTFRSRISVEEGCANFARLWGQPEMFRLLADEYAAARGADAAACFSMIAAAREKFWRRFARRHKLKYRYRSLF